MLNSLSLQPNDCPKLVSNLGFFGNDLLHLSDPGGENIDGSIFLQKLPSHFHNLAFELIYAEVDGLDLIDEPRLDNGGVSAERKHLLGLLGQKCHRYPQL